MSEVRPKSITLSVVSFNCWGIPLPLVCKDYKLRMKAIGDRLFSNSKFDVICLQEIWGQDLFEELQEKAKSTLRYWHYFYSGVLGSGVCVFSRWPIVEAMFHKWQVNGYVHKITHGDWYGGKGIGLCRLNVNGYKVNVYTCHTHAEYNNKSEYIAHKVVQAFDVAQFIRVSSRDADLTVLAADLNTEPGDLCYRVITNYAELHDSFQPENVKHEATFFCPTNSYCRKLSSDVEPTGQRIDYILFRTGSNTIIRSRSYFKPLEDRVPNQNFSFSDHEAIASTFVLSEAGDSGDCPGGFRSDSVSKKHAEESISEAYNICVHAEKNLQKDISFIKWCLTLVLFFLLVIFYIARPFLFTTAGIILMIFSVLFVFVIFVAIYLWKSIERNGILCASKEMKITLDNIQLDQ